MANNELDPKLTRDMFNTVRSFEIKNVKTQKFDDKKMVNIIMKYIVDKVGGEKKENED